MEIGGIRRLVFPNEPLGNDIEVIQQLFGHRRIFVGVAADKCSDFGDFMLHRLHVRPREGFEGCRGEAPSEAQNGKYDDTEDAEECHIGKSTFKRTW